MNTTVLKEIGLTDSETKVYYALLELGDSTRGDIVKKSGIAGSKLYEITDKLQKKGLAATYLKAGVKHFKPANPKQIIDYVEDKRAKLEALEKEARNILPNLLYLYNSSKEEQEVELLTGLKGLQTIFREQIEVMPEGSTVYVIGGTKGFGEEAVMAFFDKVHIWRTAKKITTKMLYNVKQAPAVRERYMGTDTKFNVTRYISHSSPVALNMWNDRTAILVFGKQITAIYIKSQDIANSFMEYFNILWKQSKP